jgi:hypothetical protein
MYQRTKIILDWSIAVAVYILTLLIIPISDKLFSHLNANTVNPLLNFIINAVIAVVFVGIPIFLVLKGRPAISSFVWLAVIFIISAYFLAKVEFTKDRLHFLGYGILSLFIYRALRHNVGTKMLYAWNCLIIMLFAIFDEALQFSGSGGRYFELKDIGTDWLSGLVGQFLIALVIKPKLEAVGIKIRRYTKDLQRTQDFKTTRK